MKYMSKTQAAAGHYRSATGLKYSSQLDRTLTEAKQASTARGRVFLSHSSDDVSYLKGPVALLARHGASIYLDKSDSSLPSTTSPKTARQLRSVIAQADALVLIATKSSLDSRWVPWELGLADGCHGYHRAAIFPLVEREEYEPWVGSEYIGVYPRVAYSERRSEWRVVDPTDDRSWSLESWIQL